MHDDVFEGILGGLQSDIITQQESAITSAICENLGIPTTVTEKVKSTDADGNVTEKEETFPVDVAYAGRKAKEAGLIISTKQEIVDGKPKLHVLFLKEESRKTFSIDVNVSCSITAE